MADLIKDKWPAFIRALRDDDLAKAKRIRDTVTDAKSRKRFDQILKLHAKRKKDDAGDTDYSTGAEGLGGLFPGGLETATKAVEGLSTKLVEMMGLKGKLGGALASFGKRLINTSDRFDAYGQAISNAAAINRKGAGSIIVDLTNLQRRNAKFGISTEKTFKSFNSVLQGYAKVSGQTFAKDATQITKQVSMYDKLGVSAGNTIGVFNKFEGVLGKTREASVKTSQVLNKFAQTTGQSYSKVWQDFNSNIGQFMDILDTEQMTRQTLLFQTRARRMGLSVGEIMSPLQQFETLDSAQASAGRINAVMSSLGGSFDAIKAAGMDFPERMEYISKSIQGVMGRVQASGPRASRAYTIALRKAFGLSAQQFRAMASYKPGAASAGEMMMAEGRMTGMTARDTEAAVSAAATRKEIVGAFRDARESMLYVAMPKAMGLVSTQVADSLVKWAAGEEQVAINAIEKSSAAMTKSVVAAIKEGSARKVLTDLVAKFDVLRRCLAGEPGNANCRTL